MIVLMLLIIDNVNAFPRRWGGYGKTGYTKSGYKTYYKSGRQHIVHREVYKKHHGNIPKGHEIHHKNHNKLDNRPSNLVAMSKEAHRLHHLKHRSEHV